MTQSPHIIKRLIREHIKPYKYRLMLAVVFMILAALSTAALPYLLKPVFDEVFTRHDPWLLFIFCGSVFAAFVLKGSSSYGESVIMTFVGQRIISDIQNRLFRHLMRSDLAFFHKYNSGELLSRFTNDVSMMRNAFATTMISLGKDTLTLLFLIILMFSRDFKLAAMTFIIFPAAVLPITNIGRRMRKVTYNAQGVTGNLTTQVTQVIHNIRAVKACGTEKFESKRADTIIERVFQLVYKSMRIRSAAHPIIESMGGLAVVTILAYGGWQVMHNNRTTGDFISFILALLLAYEPLKRLSNVNSNLQEGLGAAMRVFEVLDEPPTIQEAKNPVNLKNVSGALAFEHVSFAYTDHKCALDDISFSIEAGETVAFVGPSGAGKSTIINLIPRFYDVTKGSISVDGKNVRDISFETLRSHIALVSQDVALFDMTVGENIAYGCDNASKESIITAAKNAAAHEFIERLALGYDTPIGENGVKLSGGQRQRIAIARAILKDAPILLLDEATSALDTESERIVQAALKNLMIGRTTIMVAHRLSTVLDADCIYVLDDGKIVESGDHHTLSSRDTLYAKLWDAQSRSH